MGEILLYDGIGEEDSRAKNVALAISKGGPLVLRINSLGGDVFDGIAIYNQISGQDVTAVIDGVAASAASLIAMGAKRVKMAKNAQLMIHNPSMSARNAGVEEMEANVALLTNAKDALVEAYVKRTGIGEDEISAMMDAETWLTAEEALEKGFIDEIVDDIKVEARFDAGRVKAFKNAPAGLLKEIMGRQNGRRAAKAAKAEEEDPDKDVNANEDPETKEPEASDDEPTVEELQETIEGLEEKIEVLEEENAKLKAEKDDDAKAKAKAQKLRGDVVDKLEKANSLVAEQAIKIADLQEQLTASEKSASAKAASMLAGAGHRPVATAGGGSGGGDLKTEKLSGWAKTVQNLKR